MKKKTQKTRNGSHARATARVLRRSVRPRIEVEGQDSAAFPPRLVGSPTRIAGSPKTPTRGPSRGGGSRSEALMRNGVRVLVFLAYILALAAGFLLFAEPAPPKADARDRVAGIVGKIVKADYGDDRPALRRLYDELAPYTAQPGDARFASRVRYWRGFALWRRVLNGFNDKSPREEQEADLAGCVAEFDEALAKDPAFVD